MQRAMPVEKSTWALRGRLICLVLVPIGAGALPLLWMARAGPSVASDSPTPVQPAVSGFESTVHPFIQTYCTECHGGDSPEAELDLGSATLASVARDPVRWHQILRRIETGEMPPDDASKWPTVMGLLTATRCERVQGWNSRTAS